MEVVPLRYDTIPGMCFCEGLLPVCRDGMWGAVDKTGNEAVPCQYEGVTICSPEYLAVVKKGKTALLSKSGVLCTDFIYDGVSPFYHGRAVFYRDGKAGILDEKCAEILPPTYDQIEDFTEYADFTAVFIHQKTPSDTIKSKMGFIDRNGTVIVPVKYDNAYRIHEKPEKTIVYLGSEEIPVDLSKYAGK